MSMVTEFLTLSCTIRRKTIGVSSTSGTNRYTWANVASSVPCSIQVDRRMQAQRASREDAIVEYRVYFEPDISTSIAVGDRLTSIAEYSGQHFEVVSIGSSDVGNSEYVKIMAVLKKGGGTQ